MDLSPTKRQAGVAPEKKLNPLCDDVGGEACRKGIRFGFETLKKNIRVRPKKVKIKTIILVK